MSSTMNDSGDPADIERNGEAIRADMNETLNALGRKLSPGQLIDSSAGFLRDHGGDFAANLGRHARENPIPLAVTAIGLVWLIASANRAARSRTRDYGTDDFEADDYSAGEYDTDEFATAYTAGGANTKGGDGKSRFAHAKERVQGTAAHLKERVQQTASSARARLRSRRGNGAARQRVGSLASSTRSQATRVKSDFVRLAEEQPLALGAMGIALGAIIGAMIPSTRREDELLGDASDRAMRRAREMGSEQYEQLRERAVRAAERAQAAAKEAFTSETGEERQPPGAPRDEGAFRGASTPVGRA